MTQETLIWIALAVALLAAVLLVVLLRRQSTPESPPPQAEPVAETAPPAPTAPSPFLDAPDGEPDDLRQIKGIGPKLAAMLKDLGVFHYRQIAEWTPEQLAEVDSRLGNFTGRPERDQWQSQARLLASGDIKAYERAHGKLGPQGTPPPPPST